MTSSAIVRERKKLHRTLYDRLDQMPNELIDIILGYYYPSELKIPEELAPHEKLAALLSYYLRLYSPFVQRLYPESKELQTFTYGAEKHDTHWLLFTNTILRLFDDYMSCENGIVKLALPKIDWHGRDYMATCRPCGCVDFKDQEYMHAKQLFEALAKCGFQLTNRYSENANTEFYRVVIRGAHQIVELDHRKTKCSSEGTFVPNTADAETWLNEISNPAYSSDPPYANSQLQLDIEVHPSTELYNQAGEAIFQGWGSRFGDGLDSLNLLCFLCNRASADVSTHGMAHGHKSACCEAQFARTCVKYISAFSLHHREFSYYEIAYNSLVSAEKLLTQLCENGRPHQQTYMVLLQVTKLLQQQLEKRQDLQQNSPLSERYLACCKNVAYLTTKIETNLKNHEAKSSTSLTEIDEFFGWEEPKKSTCLFMFGSNPDPAKLKRLFDSSPAPAASASSSSPSSNTSPSMGLNS